MFCRIAAGLAPLPGLVRRLAAPKLPAKLFAAHQKFGDGVYGHKLELEVQLHPLQRMVSILWSLLISIDGSQLNSVDAED